MIAVRFRWLLFAVLMGGNSALGEDANSPDPTPPGTLEATSLAPLVNPNDPTLPARELFGRKAKPLAGPAHAIGGYADGCLEGGIELPITGPAWQGVGISPHRNLGAPTL